MYYVDELLENFRISNLVTIFDDIKSFRRKDLYPIRYP